MPEGSAEVDLAAGTAELHAENICAVFDAFTVANSLSADRPLGFVSGRIDSVDIKWSGVTKSFMGVHDATNHFLGNFSEIGKVTIAVTATTPKITGHGFRFVSDPATTTVNYAQIGSESNGVFFS
ncbi:MAG: hypothetical protein DMG39_13840 [Acidobacteria bacterium]|nr:MAG: hypothetical protein DMG39_13840 [Acidobacteriota bacterium]